ncbi:hypothetical protein LEP1GSC202_2805 [Leptospira yanagawae serovar Saopaulo str. Sao Paulo = ATCC 700523]|uniref:Uncharacterized protein n=1 Tax=Leptospira yanagawae serovar Saopaulo str. Sao Paulo = ATCC 700523 TaxID=1249483 RepID=A0A5E8HDZ0_9LEPT|nr:hypothetical protein LEP1GSC202_2805 [Leptospira yanagawae serovar Saopaulo str. Sao Paulo = ATCC 700523]
MLSIIKLHSVLFEHSLVDPFSFVPKIKVYSLTRKMDIAD